MAALKTQEGSENVFEVLNKLPEPIKNDCLVLLSIMQQITGLEPKIWGNTIVGFGKYKYQQKGGKKAEWFITGFAPRKQNLSIYLMSGFPQHAALLKKMGPHKTGVGCLYIKQLSDINLDLLKELIQHSFHEMKSLLAKRNSQSSN